MRPKREPEPPQGEMYEVELEQMVDCRHPLVPHPRDFVIKSSRFSIGGKQPQILRLLAALVARDDNREGTADEFIT